MDKVFHEGDDGEVYNTGGANEWSNIDIVRLVCREMDKELGRSVDDSCEKLINYVLDRPGHDRRYAIDADKIETALKWTPRYSFEQGLSKKNHPLASRTSGLGQKCCFRRISRLLRTSIRLDTDN